MPAGRPEEAHVVRTLARISRLLDSSCEGLTLSQYRVLGRVIAGEERPSRISAELLLTKPTISAVLDGLAAAGHITREPDPDDGRMIRLAATTKGRRAHRSGDAAMADRLDGLLDVVPDRGAFVAALDSIATQLDAESAARHGRHRAGHDHEAPETSSPPGRETSGLGAPARHGPPPASPQRHRSPWSPPASGRPSPRSRRCSNDTSSISRSSPRTRRSTPWIVAPGPGGRRSLRLRLRPSLLGGAGQPRRPERPAHGGVRQPATPRLRPPRRAADGTAGQPCQLRHRTDPGAAGLPPDRFGQRAVLRGRAGRHGGAQPAADARRAGDDAGARRSSR